MRVRALWLAAAGLLAAGPLHAQIPDNTMVLHQVNVGQGSAAILEFSCAAVMIDAGGQTAADHTTLVQYLTAFFQRRGDLSNTLAAVYITHNHEDHTRGLADVANAVRVRRVIENGVRVGPNNAGERPLRTVAAMPSARRPAFVVVDQDDIESGFGATSPDIDPVNCPGTDPAITILSAHHKTNPGWSETAYGNKNNGSLVIRIDFGRASFLFTGDLEKPAIKTLLEFHDGTPALDVDVYNVGHHGASNGTTREFLAAMLRPRIAVLTSGPCNRHDGAGSASRHGHPKADIVHMLKDALIDTRTPGRRAWIANGRDDFRSTTVRKAIYATGWDGNIRIEATSDGEYTPTVDTPPVPADCN
jgi:competence protein ComEC